MPGEALNRTERLFESLKAQNRKALTTYITAGDPDPKITPKAMHALVEGGADLVELGIPFSDPESDGPAIQAASLRALSGSRPTRLDDVLQMVHSFRQRDENTPVILMGYLNSLLAMGMETFTREASKAGVDGLVVVNLPIEEFEEMQPLFEAANLCIAFLVSPTTCLARAAMIASKARGFLYYVSLKGVTGAGNIDMDDLQRNLTSLREVCDLPIQIGFGIGSPQAAYDAAPLADGVIIGTNLVNLIAELLETPDDIPAALRDRAAQFRSAIDRACPPQF